MKKLTVTAVDDDEIDKVITEFSKKIPDEWFQVWYEDSTEEDFDVVRWNVLQSELETLNVELYEESQLKEMGLR